MSKDKKKQMGVLGLIIVLIAVLVGGVLFVGAVSGWFDDPKVVLETEYYKSDQTGFLELSKSKYEELIQSKKSFVVFIDQGGCTTADRLREYMQDYMEEKGILVYRMMFNDMKETSLHDQVKYYPSVAIVDEGSVRGYLRADNDEDADIYNNYEEFKSWMNRFL